MRLSRTLSLSLAVLTPLAGLAASFSDVSGDHPYQMEIDALVQAKVISGNPDGTFRPADAVNRAALLTMLYRAKGLTPANFKPACLKDVTQGSWYESYVCDAVAKGFVQGYPDGNFRPEKEVNRVEALKMITLILGLSVPESVAGRERTLLQFSDVSLTGWYTKYVLAAVDLGIIPIKGQEGTKLYPEKVLLRGEAAVYIYNALRPTMAASSSSVSSTPAVESSVRSNASSKSAAAEAVIIPQTIPFQEQRQFEKKAAISYRFTLSKATVTDITVDLREGDAGSISCRLYRLEDEGYSYEYYLGYQEGQSCYLRTALSAGNYQLQLQPTVADTTLVLDVKEGSSDGSDGFSEAKLIANDGSRTDILDVNDYEDWFKFTVPVEKKMTLEVMSQASGLRCLIYPSSKIDLFGFTGPECQKEYLYPAGNYYVGIGHSAPKAVKQTYTVRLK